MTRWVDFLFAGTAFEETAIERARALHVLGRDVPVVTVEDLVVYELLAGRPQDVADAVALLRAHEATLDVGHLDTACAAWELAPELARVRALAAST